MNKTFISNFYKILVCSVFVKINISWSIK